MLQYINNRHHLECAVLIAELDQPRIDSARKQKLAILLTTVIIHTTLRMPLGLVAFIKRVMLFRPSELSDERPEVFVLLEHALLSARGLKLFNVDTYRCARLTVIAMRPICKQPAATEALVNQLRIGIRMDQISRGRHLRARLSPR